MQIKKYLSGKLISVFKKLGFNTKLAVINFSDRSDLAHFQCNSAFSISKEINQNPMQIAQLICDNSLNIFKNECDIFVSAPGFVNFKLTSTFMQKIANACSISDRFDLPENNNPQNIILDYGGANVAKPLHVGHMRSAIIGEALKRLNIFMGNSVISDVHLGDWGLQMGLTIAQLIDDYNMGYYFGKDVLKQEITAEMLEIAYPKASARKKDDEEFNKRASDITLWIQIGKRPYVKIWKEIRKVSIGMIKKCYSDLGVSFDLWNGESTVGEIVPDIVQVFIDKKIAKESDGALIVDVSKPDDNEPMPPAIIQKHNGAQMYISTDIATIYDRQKKYKPNKIIYLTDNRQELHFKQVFRCVRLSKLIPNSLELKHITFGTVNGKDGKPFKTRDGGTMHLEDLITMVQQKAQEKIDENKTNISDKNLAKKIGVSALIFGDLINVISKDYIFDLDKFINFEGKTGPYIQYTAVRIKSLLSKVNHFENNIIIDNPYSEKIVLSLLKFIDSFDICLNENSLNTLALTLYDLASTYSNFYNEIKILSEEDSVKKYSYLSLSKLVLKAIKTGCGILGIAIPEKM